MVENIYNILTDVNVDMLTVGTSHILSEIIHQYDFTNVIHELTRMSRPSSMDAPDKALHVPKLRLLAHLAEGHESLCHGAVSVRRPSGVNCFL